MIAALWRCGKCRRVFANRNQSHACGRHTLAHHFSGKPPAIRALYRAVVAAIRSIGPVRVVPEKTRIAFQVRMSFAQVTPCRGWLDGHVVLARRLEHRRFRSVQTFSPRNHLHTYLVGAQQHLQSGAVQHGGATHCKLSPKSRVGASERRERATRPEGADEAASEGARRGVRGAKPLG